MPQLSVPKSLFRYQSGRVIALGRVMLVTCFLIALLLDRGDASQEARGTFGLLLGYEVLAIVIAAVTWRNWWLDARLAVATHALDMAVFTAIVFSANGTTSSCATRRRAPPPTSAGCRCPSRPGRPSKRESRPPENKACVTSQVR